MITLFIKSDNTIQVDNLRYAHDGGYVNDATVTFTLRDIADTAIVGAENIVMGYVAASDGKYQGILDAVPSALLTVDTDYFLEITAVRGTVDGFWRIQCKANYKGEG